MECNAAVFEVGLGGRLDATNIVTPKVSVITSLSYDHMAVLGNTLALIAGEKAGIIKQGVPVVSSPQKDEALEVLERVAKLKNAELTLVGRDVKFEVDRVIFGWTDGLIVDCRSVTPSTIQPSNLQHSLAWISSTRKRRHGLCGSESQRDCNF